jgi:hypothetical protein
MMTELIRELESCTLKNFEEVRAKIEGKILNIFGGISVKEFLDLHFNSGRLDTIQVALETMLAVPVLLT